MPAQETSSVLQIGEWIVHPELDCISRGTETQKLEPRAMRLLLCLADSAGAVVSVDRLLAEVWPDVVVGSASVYQAVSQLRKILGDVDAIPTYIATVPRKGYRLIASVQRATGPAHTPQAPVMLRRAATPRRVWVVAGAFVTLALAAAYFLGDKAWLSKHPTGEGETPAVTVVVSDKSLAVLPFVDMSEKKDQEYFADGMAEEIIDRLSKVPDLRVPARTSSFYFKGKPTKIPDIALELGVAHVLEGSIRRSGSHLRVTARLVRADNGYPLWSETYDRDVHDVFKVQDNIANAVVQVLQITLMGGSLTRQAGGTHNLAAYQLELRAVGELQLGSKESIDASRKHAEQAIKLDPDFALAFTTLGWAYASLAQRCSALER